MKGLIFTTLLLLCPLVSADMSITMQAEHNPNDLRLNWVTSLLNLALERTTEDYGAYTLEPAPDMELARRWHTLKSKKYPNYIIFSTYRAPHIPEFSKDYAIIKFPLLMGLLGYRICFHTKEKASYIEKMLSKGLIKNLTIGQGKNWTDTAILRHSGYTVTEAQGYAELFKMTHANRFDLFCRSVHEIYDEYHSHKDAQGLLVEQTFAFNYPMPLFIYTHKDNHALVERLSKGLELAYQDGSITAAFEQYMGERVKFARLSERTIIQLENPALKGLKSDYARYYYPILDPTLGSSDQYIRR
ncbi:MAG: hypothetical protein COA42_18865 [Alteromonadaceae bacterium]|nr:MAG: hypothetical protein COA42_18865 [Alteromonadaceae bacterium]